MSRLFSTLCLILVSQMIFSESELQLIDVNSGIIATTRQVLVLNEFTQAQFSSNEGSIQTIVNEKGNEEFILFKSSISKKPNVALTFYPGAFLNSKTKFEFKIQSNHSKIITGEIKLLFLDNYTYEIPERFEITSEETTVEIQLKGIPLPIDEIEKIQWVVYPDSSETETESETEVEFRLSDLSCFSDTSRHFSNGILSKTDDTINISQINQNASLSLSDSVPPTIADLKFNDKTILDGDYVSSRPQLTAAISDLESGVSQWSILVLNESNDSLAYTVPTQNISPTVSAYSLDYEFEDLLPEGQFYIKLTALDNAGNATELESVPFIVSYDQQFKNVVFGPVPFNPNAQNGKFNYELTQDADIDIYIYSINGEEVWNYQASSGSINGSIGFNEVDWNGENKYGDQLGNGPYIAYIVANFEDDKAVKKIKIMVLK